MSGLSPGVDNILAWIAGIYGELVGQNFADSMEYVILSSLLVHSLRRTMGLMRTRRIRAKPILSAEFARTWIVD
jgi:hypothetical protein